MNYTVLWNPKAEDELAQLWLSAPDRDPIANAADEIDALLRRDPLTAGESRADGVRILIRPPLAVRYEVLEADRQVHVLQVWRWGSSP